MLRLSLVADKEEIQTETKSIETSQEGGGIVTGGEGWGRYIIITNSIAQKKKEKALAAFRES